MHTQFNMYIHNVVRHIATMAKNADVQAEPIPRRSGSDRRDVVRGAAGCPACDLGRPHGSGLCRDG